MAVTAAGVQRVFDLLGLSVSQSRINELVKSGKSVTQIRNDLLAWGKKQGGDTYKNMLTSLVTARFGQSPVTAERAASIAQSIIDGTRTIEKVYADIDKATGQTGGPTGGGGGGTPAVTAPQGVLAGGQTIRVRVNGVDRYYQVYEFPAGSGNLVSYQFNNLAQAEKALGKGFDVTTRTEAWFNQRNLASGQAEEVVGQKGNFNKFTQDLMREAAVAAGVRDPSMIGKIANSREMQQIMAQKMIGDWTDEQVLAAQRQTNFWKNVLYPGIDAFYGQTTEPEKAWMDYRATVSPALRELGYQPGADGTFNAQIKKMLGNKIDAQTFLNQAPTFIRAKQNAEYATVLNQWAESELGKQVTFNDWFDLMAGESAPDLNDVAEKATLAWTAQNQGSNISQQQIRDLADRSQLTDQEMVAAFSDFNQSVLALGDEGLGRYGLSRDEVLSVAAGVNPQSGRSIDEAKLLIAKTARELSLADDEKINFYVGFSPQGTPVRPGLTNLAPESA